MLRKRLVELAQQHKRWGYRMLTGALRLEGWHLNHKRAYRLYKEEKKEEKLDLRPKHRKRLKSEKRGPIQVPTASNQAWSLEFIFDCLSAGRSFRTLNLIDLFTRQCLAIEVDTSVGSERVVRVLEQVVQCCGCPKLLQIDNGPEFQGKKLDIWASKN